MLHDGTIVRAQDAGYLVHMIVGFGVKNPAVGRQVMALLRAGKDGKAQRLANRQFLTLAGPLSPGGMQQAVLNVVKPALAGEEVAYADEPHQIVGVGQAQAVENRSEGARIVETDQRHERQHDQHERAVEGRARGGPGRGRHFLR